MFLNLVVQNRIKLVFKDRELVWIPKQSLKFFTGSIPLVFGHFEAKSKLQQQNINS